MTHAELLAHFAELPGVSLRLIMDAEGLRNKGFAYLDVLGHQPAAAAVAKKIVVEGHPLRMHLSCTALTTLRHRTGTFSDESLHSCIVRGLPRYVAERALLKLVGEQDFVEMRIPRNEKGINKGFAFLDYASPVALGRALMKNGFEFKGRPLKIEEKGLKPPSNSNLKSRTLNFHSNQQ